MFEAIVEASTLQDAVESVRVLVDECKIQLREDAFAIRAVDPANVGMVDMALDAGAFESYEADGGLIGIDLKQFEDVIAMAESGSLIHLALDERTGKLQVDMNTTTYTQALIDPDSVRQMPDIPTLDLPVEVTYSGEMFQHGVKAVELAADRIRFRADPDAGELYIEGEGDTDDVDTTLGDDELIAGSRIDGPANSLFSLDYVSDITKVLKDDDEVTQELGEEYPTKLRTQFADGRGRVEYMLSPRIQAD